MCWNIFSAVLRENKVVRAIGAQYQADQMQVLTGLSVIQLEKERKNNPEIHVKFLEMIVTNLEIKLTTPEEIIIK